MRAEVLLARTTKMPPSTRGARVVTSSAARSALAQASKATKYGAGQIAGAVLGADGHLAMANSGPNTNGSQFFITFGPADFLNGGYTIFGQVVEGMDVVNGITRRDPQKNPDYPGDMIESITITEK